MTTLLLVLLLCSIWLPADSLHLRQWTRERGPVPLFSTYKQTRNIINEREKEGERKKWSTWLKERSLTKMTLREAQLRVWRKGREKCLTDTNENSLSGDVRTSPLFVCRFDEVASKCEACLACLFLSSMCTVFHTPRVRSVSLPLERDNIMTFIDLSLNVQWILRSSLFFRSQSCEKATIEWDRGRIREEKATKWGAKCTSSSACLSKCHFPCYFLHDFPLSRFTPFHASHHLLVSFGKTGNNREARGKTPDEEAKWVMTLKSCYTLKHGSTRSR